MIAIIWRILPATIIAGLLAIVIGNLLHINDLILAGILLFFGSLSAGSFALNAERKSKL